MNAPYTDSEEIDYSRMLDLPGMNQRIPRNYPEPTPEMLQKYPEIKDTRLGAGLTPRQIPGGTHKKTLKVSKPGGDIVTTLLLMRNQIKLYHWQTRSFAVHKATDDLTAELDTSIDTFVEVYMGKYGRPSVSGSTKLHNFTSEAARTFVDRQTMYLTKVLPKKLKKTDTDLLNIRDEILATLNQTRFLFTLV
jgi:hypothetical protein